jgi:hypothetical protein
VKHDIWFKVRYKDKDILVLTEKLTEQREKENILIYGSKYGVQEICVVDGDDIHKLTSNEVVTGSEVLEGLLDSEREHSNG